MMNIIYPVYNKDGTDGIAIMYIVDMSLDIKEHIKNIPKGTPYKIVEELFLYDLYYDAYEYDQEIGAKLNFQKAKKIAHDIRRNHREKEFCPYDDIISKQIPNKMIEAEEKRKEIRNKYEMIQKSIEESKDIDELNKAVSIFFD